MITNHNSGDSPLTPREVCATALASQGVPLSPSQDDLILENVEHAEFERRWSIVTGQKNRLEALRLREQFERLARQAMVELGFRFHTSSEAVDTWLDLLKRESPYCHSGWAIPHLALASAEYCSELRIRALEADQEAKASAFSMLEHQFRGLRDPRGELHAVERGLKPDSQEVQPSASPKVEAFLATPNGDRAPDLEAATNTVSEARGHIPARLAVTKDRHVVLLERILEKRPTSVEKWARDHMLGRTTVYDWKAARLAGKFPRGKVSDGKGADIEKAIEDDARALGLELGIVTRTGSD